MTFADRETSRTLGEPIELYLFVGAAAAVDAEIDMSAGEFGPYAYTDAESEVVYDGVTYLPVTIDRDPIGAAGTLDKATLKVTMEAGLTLGDQFIAYPPNQVVNLFLRQGHSGDDPAEPGNFPVVWTGRVLGCAHPPGETTYTCEPISTALKRPGLRRNYQVSCPHALYGPECGADRAAATIDRTVEALTQTTITLPAGWDSVHPYQKYFGGMVTWLRTDGAMEARSILSSADGLTLRISGNTRGLEVGAGIKVILGCSRSLVLTAGVLVGDCPDLHGNIVNYGGQPFIPTTNPLGPSSNYY